VTLDLLAAQLRMIGVVGLLTQVQVDQERLDLGIITCRQTLNVEGSHLLSMLA
jgi:hypothetical protein